MAKGKTVSAPSSAPRIIGHLEGLDEPPQILALRIHQFVTVADRADSAEVSMENPADAAKNLADMIKVLEEARRKVNAAHPAIRLQYLEEFKSEFGVAPTAWALAVTNFNAATDHIVDRAHVLQAQAESSARKGNQGPPHHLYLVMAFIVGTLKNAGAHNHNARARKILEAYGLKYPTGGQYGEALKHGERLINERAPGDPLDRLLEQIKKASLLNASE